MFPSIVKHLSSLHHLPQPLEAPSVVTLVMCAVEYTLYSVSLRFSFVIHTTIMYGVHIACALLISMKYYFLIKEVLNIQMLLI